MINLFYTRVVFFVHKLFEFKYLNKKLSVRQFDYFKKITVLYSFEINVINESNFQIQDNIIQR